MELSIVDFLVLAGFNIIFNNYYLLNIIDNKNLLIMEGIRIFINIRWMIHMFDAYKHPIFYKLDDIEELLKKINRILPNLNDNDNDRMFSDNDNETIARTSEYDGDDDETPGISQYDYMNTYLEPTKNYLKTQLKTNKEISREFISHSKTFSESDTGTESDQTINNEIITDGVPTGPMRSLRSSKTTELSN